MYSSKQDTVAQILDDLGFPNPSTELTENMIAWGLDDPDVFTPMKGLREAISAWVLECWE